MASAYGILSASKKVGSSSSTSFIYGVIVKPANISFLCGIIHLKNRIAKEIMQQNSIGEDWQIRNCIV